MKYCDSGREPAQSHREVDQEDEAHQVVVELEHPERGVTDGKHHDDHDDQRHHRQDEDEQLVRLAESARGRQLLIRLDLL